MKAPLALLTLLLVSGCMSVRTGDPDLLFYASFDQGLDADLAAGSPNASGTARITRGGQGLKGEALLAQHGFIGVELYTGVRYLLEGNLLREQGTVEFFVKPLPGFLKTNVKGHWRRIFLCSHDKQFVENKRLYRWFRIDFARKQGALRLRFFEQDMHEGTGSHLQIVDPPVGEGHWTHVAYAWRDRERVVVIDGVRAEEQLAEGMLVRAGRHLMVGGGPHGGFQEAANALIDELKIWRTFRVPEG